MAAELKPHERIWLEEVRTRLTSGKPIDYPEMMVELRDKLPAGFTPIQIDLEYLQGSQLTVAGLYALDPNAQELKDLERLILKIREWKILDPHRQKVSAEQCSTALGFSRLYAERILTLTGTLGNYWSASSGTREGIGSSEVDITSLDALAAYLKFTSVAEALRDRTRTRQSSGPPGSWETSTFPLLTDFANDPAEEVNAPFSAEEQIQVKRVVEEIRIYITSTYALGDEPLATVNRKLDYLTVASTRLGRKDWKIICVGILVTLAIPQLTPSGPGVRELFAIAWHLVRHVLDSVISPPLLH